MRASPPTRLRRSGWALLGLVAASSCTLEATVGATLEATASPDAVHVELPFEVELPATFHAEDPDLDLSQLRLSKDGDGGLVLDGSIDWSRDEPLHIFVVGRRGRIHALILRLLRDLTLRPQRSRFELPVCAIRDLQIDLHGTTGPEWSPPLPEGWRSELTADGHLGVHVVTGSIAGVHRHTLRTRGADARTVSRSVRFEVANIPGGQRWLAYVKSWPGFTGSYASLHFVDVCTGGPERIVETSAPAGWLPSSSRDPEQYTAYLRAGTHKLLFSPDGRYVAFIARLERPDAHELYLLDLDTPHATPVRVSGPFPRVTPIYWEAGVSAFAWSPDGTKLVFTVRTPTETRAIPYVVDVTRPSAPGQPRALLSTGANPDFATQHLAFSPDSAKVAFVALRGLHVVDLSSGAPSTGPVATGVDDFAWSPSSSGLVMNTARGVEWLATHPSLGPPVPVSSPYTPVDPLDTPPTLFRPIEFSPDGDWVSFGARVTARTEAYAVNLSGPNPGQPVQLTFTGAPQLGLLGAGWLANGSLLLSASYPHGPGGVRPATWLFRSADPRATPDLNPLGGGVPARPKRRASRFFLSGDRSLVAMGGEELVVFETMAPAPPRLVSTDEVGWLTWSPDDASLAYRNSGELEIWDRVSGTSQVVSDDMDGTRAVDTFQVPTEGVGLWKYDGTRIWYQSRINATRHQRAMESVLDGPSPVAQSLDGLSDGEDRTAEIIAVQSGRGAP